jgi:hypothetical protein
MDSDDLFDDSQMTAGPSVDVDLTLFSYLHPALIGRLPTAWLYIDGDDATREQPRRLAEV